MEMSHDMNSDTEQLIDDNGAAATAVANSNHHQQQQADISSDEEEINTGNYRPWVWKTRNGPGIFGTTFLSFI